MRATISGRAQIVMDDTSSHGGKVISGSPPSNWGARRLIMRTLVVTATTNPEPNTCVDVQCNCEIIWSFAQQFATRQIVDPRARAQRHTGLSTRPLEPRS